MTGQPLTLTRETSHNIAPLYLYYYLFEQFLTTLLFQLLQCLSVWTGRRLLFTINSLFS